MQQTLKQQWFSNIRADSLSGLVVALALIPEAIAFSIIAGVDPKVGLYASFCIAVVISFAGGRPAMISAATGAMALVMASLVKSHGLEYLLAATILTGVIQIIAGFLKLGSLMRFVARAVVVGFVNALAILIFLAQLPELTNVTWHTYALVAAALGIIYLFPYLPKIGKILPSPLVAIVVLTIVSYFMGLDVRTIGDMGELPDSLPVFLLPNIPLNLETLLIILPYSLSLAAVGLLESLMTATIVDEMTETESDKNRECKGQGIANIACGFMGGMAGCAMIGQSVINVKSGGRTRLSTFLAGIYLLIMVVFLADILKIIPMPVLVAVMIMVSIGTFNWQSIRDLKTHPIGFNAVMLVTVSVVVYTHNLALGVFAGVLLAALFFANKIGRYMLIKSLPTENDSVLAYGVIGQVFFASSDDFINSFTYDNPAVKQVSIDLTHAHFWDVTGIAALDKVVLKYRKAGVEVEVFGLNEASQTLVDKFGVHDKSEDVDIVFNH
ncbi:SulP family inorganic anion transporter [Actinobacillus suis]|uniref:Sulfate transporter n=2 Tax=Actinobacillus suis TaxID=716 RepID=K0G572_ACTSU|nr:SulP family inorganic anion transporter [Actinobacillus suis]AFU19288.1 sulfate transporter [Actinobacillus suis H91-0380]AIJ31427.1 sulfate transporter [Actinobacillus suis ATCC 33415]MCO4166575.1 SulP family inorganic anion transporter [Actinobacillus suis]MCO4168159.1 SulP family inorganic anion transporter [Actinobacillus suis]MCQ9629582.1 SulP family inorganic anion transporter [Actinobacillus suis]